MVFLKNVQEIEIRMSSLEKERNEEKNRFISEIRSKEEIINQMRSEKTSIYAEVDLSFIIPQLFSFFSFDLDGKTAKFL